MSPPEDFFAEFLEPFDFLYFHSLNDYPGYVEFWDFLADFLADA